MAWGDSTERPAKAYEGCSLGCGDLGFKSLDFVGLGCKLRGFRALKTWFTEGSRVLGLRAQVLQGSWQLRGRNSTLSVRE